MICSSDREQLLDGYAKVAADGRKFVQQIDVRTNNDSLVILMAAIPVFAQSPPASPDRPWHTSDERRITNDGKRLRQPVLPIEPDKAYSLAELIDLAEAHNPETRVAWENARAQGAALGIARSELYPTLSAVALSGVDRAGDSAWHPVLPPHGSGGSGVTGSQLHNL